MVLKRSKDNINSGNSFHNRKTKYFQRLYGADQHVIVKKYFGVEHFPKTIGKKKQVENDYPTVDHLLKEKINGYIDDGDLDLISQENVHRWNQWNRWNQSDTIYSLNKRKRWLIPEQVKDMVEDENLEQAHFKLTLVERVIEGDGRNTRRSEADVFGYHDSSLKDNKHVTPNKKYSFYTDLQRNAPHREDVEEEEGQNTPQVWWRRGHIFPGPYNNKAPTEVRYEVCSPRPLHSIQDHNYGDWYWKGKGHKALCKTKGKRKFEKINQGIRKADHPYQSGFSEVLDDDLAVDQAEEFHSLTENSCSSYHTTDTFLLDELFTDTDSRYSVLGHRGKKRKSKIEYSQHIPKNCPNMTSSQDIKKYGKGCAVFLEEPMRSHEEEEHGMDSDSEITPNTLSLLPNDSETFEEREMDVSPILCQVSKDSISSKYLESQYEQDYSEGYSCPRKFTINIDIDNLPIGEKVILLCQECGDLKEKENVSKLSVHIKCSLDPSLVDNLCSEISMMVGDDTFNFCDLVYLIKAIVDEKPKPEWAKKEDGKSRKLGFEPFLVDLQNWATHVYEANEAFEILKDEPLPNSRQAFSSQRSISVVSNGPDGHSDDFCDICFACIGFDENEHQPGMALKSCRHWFCMDCWKSHVTERLKRGDVAIACPGHECKKVIDHVTLLSLLSYTKYMQYIRRIQERKLEGSRDWKWCPNSKCGRVVRNRSAGENRSLILEQCVNCNCGDTWCFDCEKEAHWPAPCKQASAYHKMIEQNGTDSRALDSKVFFVHVKKCPNCLHPMEKNGGCSHMRCRCGLDFCWECLGPWSAHGQFLTCPRPHRKEKTMELDSETSVSLPIQYFNRSVKHRVSRKKWTETRSYDKACGLAFDLQRRNFSSSQMKSGTRGRMSSLSDVSCSSDEEGPVNSLGSEDIAFFLSTIKFLKQVRYISEYTCVIMSCSTKKRKQKRLGVSLDRLEFIADKLEQLITRNKKKNLHNLKENLTVLTYHGKTCIEDMMLHLMRSRLHVSKQGVLK